MFHMLSHAARFQVLPGLIGVLLVAACSSSRPIDTTGSSAPADRAEPPAAPVSPPVRASSPLSVADRAAVAAAGQVGVPYRYGGATTAGFDCSGLVVFAYSTVGVRLPRTTGDLWRQLSPVASHDLRVGDVLFFDIEGKVSHVGLYLGDERFVHAPSSGKEVTIASLAGGYYEQALLRGGRPD